MLTYGLTNLFNGCKAELESEKSSWKFKATVVRGFSLAVPNELKFHSSD